MAGTSLREPIPRARPVNTATGVPVFGVLKLLPYRERAKSVSYPDILRRRKSERHFKKPSATDIGGVLWLTQGIAKGRSQTKRGLPSPGGLHAVRILVLNWPGHADKALLYEPEFHSLSLVASGPNIRRCRRAFSEALPFRGGVVMWFIGDFARISGKYRNPESLLWKEAGVLTAGVYLAASYLKLKCCAIGKNGTTELARCEPPLENFSALGACVVGR